METIQTLSDGQMVIEKIEKASDIRRPKKQYNPEQLFEFYFFAR